MNQLHLDAVDVDSCDYHKDIDSQYLT